MAQRLLTRTALTPTRLAGVVFWGIVLLQGFHELEHVLQVLQRFVFNDPKGAGLLGSWLDSEPVHLAFNAGFLFLLALAYTLGGFLSRQDRPRPLVFWLMTFALVFQSYHMVEHAFKIAQFLETGINGTPGILGNVFNGVWLHAFFSTVLSVAVAMAFFLGGYHRAAFRRSADSQAVHD